MIRNRSGIIRFVTFVTLAVGLVFGIYVWANSFWDTAVFAQTHSLEPGTIIYNSVSTDKTIASLQKIGCPQITHIKIAVGADSNKILVYYKVKDAYEVTVSGVKTPSSTEGWVELQLDSLSNGQIKVIASNTGCTVSKNFQITTYEQIVTQAAILGSVGIGLGMLLDIFIKVLTQGKAGVFMSLIAMLPLGRKPYNLRGKVVDKKSGSIIKDAIVAVWIKTDEGFKPYLADVTDKNGEFALYVPNDVEVSLNVYAKGYRPVFSAQKLKRRVQGVVENAELFKGEIFKFRAGEKKRLAILMEPSDIEDQRVEYVLNVTRRAGRQFSDILVWFVWLLGAFYTGWSAYNLGWPLYLNLVLGLYVLVLVVKMYGFIKPPKSLLAARALSSLKVLRE